MATFLRVLILEDQPDDCILMLRELQREGFTPDWQRVETESEYLALLQSDFDLILSDYSLPQFDALRALQLAREQALDIPFIIVSGTISEEIAVECMKNGAADYLMKDRLMRLGPAVTHALREKQLREEKRQAEAALRESEMRFALAIRGANDGLWDAKFTPDKPWNDPDTPVYYSPRFKALLEYQDYEFGNQLRSWIACLHPEDCDRVMRTLTAHLKEQVPYNIEYRLRTKSGRYLWVSGHGQALWNEEGCPIRMAGSIRDVSERKWGEEVLQRAYGALELRVQERTAELAQANEDLRKSEERHRSLARNFPNGIVALFDRDLRYTLAEGAGLSQLGFSKAMLEGRSIEEVWPPETRAIIEERYRAALAGKATVTEISYNDQVHLVYVLPLTSGQGETYAGMMMTQDITARIEVERLKEELMAMVSHELRTPLTSLRGFSELLLQKEFSPEQQRRFLSIIQQESTRLAELVNDFLDLRRMEVGHQIFHCEAIDIEGLLRERVNMLPSVDGKLFIRLVAPSSIAPVWADGDRIRQVLANLLSNAMKYSPHGGEVTVGVRQEDTEVIVWVADQGIGIPPVALPKLFSKFFRVDNEQTKKIRGTGLGLALVKEIIEEHQGRVWVESELGKGSTFFFSLPVATQFLPESSPVALAANG